MRFCAVFSLLLLLTVGFSGCPKPSPPPINTQNVKEGMTADVPVMPNPHPILDQMVSAYQSAVSYSDQATVQIIGKTLPPHTAPDSWNCTVVFQKPNQFRLNISEGTYVSDGEHCYAQIQSLPDQFLSHPAQEIWTLETLFQNVLLDRALTLGLPPSVLRFPPQLILLLANYPLNTFCPKGAKVEWLEQRFIGQIPCDVVRIRHSDGNRDFWISQENHALLRLDYQPVGLPIPEGFESIEAIRIEMTNAQFNGHISDDTFQLSLPPHAVQVHEFTSDAQGLPRLEEHRHSLNLMAEKDLYRLVDQQIESVISAEPSPTATVTPKTFTLSPIWTQPLVGGSSIALLPSPEPKLLIPCEGNLVAALDLQGKSLQKEPLINVNDSIIMGIRVSPKSTDKPRMGILTFDSKFFLFESSFQPLDVPSALVSEKSTDVIRDFQFVPYDDQEMLVLGRQRDVAEGSSRRESLEQHQTIVTALDSQGHEHWTCTFDGMPYQLSTALIANKQCVLVSYAVRHQDLILVRTLEGVELDSVEIPFGRHVLWFQMYDSTIYTLLEDPSTGDVHFAGLNRYGKGLWSRLLPTGEYEIDPVFVPKKEQWFVPLPNGEIMVFDLQGNVIDKFTINVIPTGLFCAEVNDETLLIVTDGQAVSAWKLQ